jgi:hypothetical protein
MNRNYGTTSFCQEFQDRMAIDAIKGEKTIKLDSFNLQDPSKPGRQGGLTLEKLREVITDDRDSPLL